MYENRNNGLTEKQRRENEERFETILRSTGRMGIENLITKLIKNKASDFYEAPASTRFHCAYPGGLLQHSLDVYDRLYDKFFGSRSGHWPEYAREQKITPENVAIIALLHDLYKISYYEVDVKNCKCYDPEKVAAAPGSIRKRDSKGEYIWEEVEFYTINDKMPYGHGEKSVMLASKYISLNTKEKFAIRWAGGFRGMNNAETYMLADAIQKYPICLALNEANMEATYTMGRMAEK